MRRDVVPGDYLRLKNLWNDPGSGRFIRRGRSTAKAQAMRLAEVFRPGSVTRDRLRGEGSGLVKVADNRLAKSGIFRGEVVRVDFLDDQFATVRLDGTRRGRSYKVRWERFDDSYVPQPGDRARGDVNRSERRDTFAYEQIVEAWGDGNRVADIAQRNYGSFSIADLRTPEGTGRFLEAVGRAARDADVFRRNNPDLADSGRIPPRFPVEALITDATDLPQMAGTPGNEDALSAWRLADSMSAFHFTPRLGEAWSPMDTSYAALGIRDLNPSLGYKFDKDASNFHGEKVARSTETSPLMERMTTLMGQPEVSTGSTKDPSMLAELQTDLAHMEPENTRLFLTSVVPGRKDRPTDPIPLRARLRVGPSGFERSEPGWFTYDDSWSGTVRHEYGHYLDDMYQSAYKMYAFDDTLKGRQRAEIMALFGARFSQNNVPPWMAGLLSRYGAYSTDEAMAELWALISHPDYPEMKAELEALVQAGPPGAPGVRDAETQLMFLDLVEAYFSPDSTPFF